MISEERLDRMGCGDEPIVAADLIAEIWRLRLALGFICSDKVDDHEGKEIARAALDGTQYGGVQF